MDIFNELYAIKENALRRFEQQAVVTNIVENWNTMKTRYARAYDRSDAIRRQQLN